MYYLKASVDKPLKLISCGQFITDKPWTHMKRNLDSFELIIGVNGAVFLQQDDEEYVITPGSSLLLLPGHTHKGYAASKKGTSFYWMHFTYTGEYALFNEKEVSKRVYPIKVNPLLNELSGSILVPVFMKVISCDKLTIQVRQLMHSANTKSYSSLENDYMLTLVLMELTQQFINGSLKNAPEKGDSRIDAILEWLRIHMNEDISVVELANRFDFNKDYLTRFFKKHTGMSVVQYKTAMKMIRAKELLCNSALNIKVIAYTLGYKDEKYFMKQFKVSEKLTPSEYRNTFYKIHLNNK